MFLQRPSRHYLGRLNDTLAMTIIKFVLLVFLISFFRVDGKFPGPVLSLLQMGWDTASPFSIQNRIKDLAKDIETIKTHLQKLEHGVVFGRDMKTIEYLIDQFNAIVITSNANSKLNWANLALSLGSDGFRRSLTSLEEMLEGTSQIFAEGSIFGLIAKDEKNEDSVCTDLEEASSYLFSLWALGHATWAQAYEIKHDNFKENAKRLQEKATSKMDAFVIARDKAFPEHCHCFESGIFYAQLDYMLGKQLPTQPLSSRSCQAECNSDDKCMGFTFIKPSSKCYKFENVDNENEGKFLIRKSTYIF